MDELERRRDILFLTRKEEHTPEEQARYAAYVHESPCTTLTIAQMVDLERDKERWVRDWVQSLNTWNLKYDSFPSIEDLRVYAMEYGYLLSDEHVERLSNAMRKRADSYWGVR